MLTKLEPRNPEKWFEVPQVKHLRGMMQEGKHRQPETRRAHLREQFAGGMGNLLSPESLFDFFTKPSFWPDPLPPSYSADDGRLGRFLKTYSDPSAARARCGAWVNMTGQPPGLLLVQEWKRLEERPDSSALAKVRLLMDVAARSGREWDEAREYWNSPPEDEIVKMDGHVVGVLPARVDEVEELAHATTVYAAFISLVVHHRALPTRKQILDGIDDASSRQNWDHSVETALSDNCKKLGLTFV